MAQETKVEETRCSLQTFERNRYFYGKPMTVSDFEAEQRYLIGKQRYVNRLVHGAGVLCGLQVTLPDGFSADRPRIELAEGAALDCCGNLIVNSRSGTADIKGEFNPSGLNYLYVKYAECSKHPVMLAANGSSCEEVCCYNRIQETFEVVAGRTPPGAGGDDAQDSVRNGGPQVLPPLGSGEAAPDPETARRALTEQYYREHLRTCPGCDDPLVFLAALDAGKGAVDEVETAKYRSVVYNNPMLHELLCGHVTDYNNPHLTSAEQVLALKSVNGVGNSGDRPFVANIDLDSGDETIDIAGDVNARKIDLGLAANAVRVSHLNAEVFKNLIQPSKTVTVEPNAGKKIVLSTTPAKSVTSVGGSKVVGASSSYAPEDHAHDLADGVAERRHLNADVYANLVQGGGAVKVEPNPAARTIRISAEVAAPADDPNLVSSVGGAKRLGASRKFAREDHAHDLRINGRPPNGAGEFLLTPGANVTITNGPGVNELVIGASGGGRAVITTGFFVFENVLPQELRMSTLIAHKHESEVVAIVLAEERAGDLQPIPGLKFDPANATARFGDITAFAPAAPFLMAELDYSQKTIQISLKDRRQGTTRFDTSVMLAEEGGLRTPASAGEADTSVVKDSSTSINPTGVAPTPQTDDGIVFNPDARTYRVRWWAIPA